MRVDGNRPIQPAATRRGTRSGVAGAGSFAEVLGAEPAAAPSAAAPASGVSALFALQEVPDATVRRRKAMARASKLLDRLDSLQLGLLDGAIDRKSLAELAGAVRSAREEAGDPALQSVLDEIELRAAVELAKLSSAP
jgi:class II flagellar assembly regulator FliX